MIELSGIAWDHPRGYEPLIAASSEFNKLYPDVTITWDVCSLKEFDEMVEDPQIEYNSMIMGYEHPTVGKFRTTGFPVFFSDTPQKIEKPAPILNEHAAEILREYCNYSEKEIEKLKSQNK